MSSSVPRLLHQEFDRQAALTPEAGALRENDNSITFAELSRRANSFAAALVRAGVVGGSTVGVHVDRSIDYVVALLAVLKTGAAVLPLPPSYPESRLREILSFAALDLVVDHALVALPTDDRHRTISFPRIFADAGDVPPTAGGDDGQPAFVLCTSGSTGAPKMIVRSHRSFFHRLEWTWNEHPYSAGEVCYQKSFMTTTHAIYELFEPLLRGTPTWIIPDDEVRDLERFWRNARTRCVSRLLLVPSFIQASLDSVDVSLPTLRVLVIMGEYVSPALARRVVTAFGGSAEIFSIYGSTEASSTLVTDLRASLRGDRELPLGKPISGDVTAHVLDDSLAAVAEGQAGMLHIGGAPLFSGYFRVDKASSEIFAKAGGDGPLYNTRDQVQLLPGGELRFIGRVDDTVKIRGFRVDTQEIERIILQHPGVKQAAVVARADDSGTHTLVGFYLPACIDRTSTFNMLRSLLPAYMVPSVLVGVDAFPVTSSGKTDRRRLLDELATPTKQNPFDRELTPTEVQVRDVWSGILHHGEIDTDSSFFEVGGTSLSVFAALHRLREKFAIDATSLGDQAIYQYPTLEKLASHIDAMRGGAAPATLPENIVAVTLKKGTDPSLAPLFLFSSAGGTLGAYHKLVKAITTSREVIGLRDPFIWGAREPTQTFGEWVEIYVGALREKQPRGPYHLCAYSSASVFAYEVAQNLRRAGEEIATFILVDPLAMEMHDTKGFGHWVFRARMGRPVLKPAVLAAGLLRRLIRTVSPGKQQAGNGGLVLNREEFEELANSARTSSGHILGFAALLELNTGLPFSMTRPDLSKLTPGEYFSALAAKVQSVSPEIDAQTLERMVVQYYVQTRAQHRYRLERYDGDLLLLEPAHPHNGLLASQFRPFVKRLTARSLPLNPNEHQARIISEAFGERLMSHYLCMRDDTFVQALAKEVDAAL